MKNKERAKLDINHGGYVVLKSIENSSPGVVVWVDDVQWYKWTNIRESAEHCLKVCLSNEDGGKK